MGLRTLRSFITSCMGACHTSVGQGRARSSRRDEHMCVCGGVWGVTVIRVAQGLGQDCQLASVGCACRNGDAAAVCACVRRVNAHRCVHTWSVGASAMGGG